MGKEPGFAPDGHPATTPNLVQAPGARGQRRQFGRSWLPSRRRLPYLGTALLVWLLLRHAGMGAVWQLLAQVKGRWLLVGFGWYLVTNVVRAYRLGALWPVPGRFGPLRLLPDMIALSFFNNVLPARAGELSFPVLMRRRHGVPLGESAALLLLLRFFDYLAVVSLYLVLALLSRSRLSPEAIPAVTTIGVLLGLSLLLLAAVPWLGRHGLQLCRWLLGRLNLVDRAAGALVLGNGRQAVAAFERVHRKRVYVVLYGWSVLGWLATFAWFAAFLQAIGLAWRYPLVVVGATLATLAKAIPLITVGGFGAHEAGWTLGFRLTGMATATAIASGFAVNILTLLASLVFGALAFAYVYACDSLLSKPDNPAELRR